MIRWLKQRLPRVRRDAAVAAQDTPSQGVAIAAQLARTRAAMDANHAAWLATLPADLRAHPRLQMREEQADARDWAALTPPSDCAHAIKRHLRWTTPPPDLPRGVTMATKIGLLMITATNADGRFYLPHDLAHSFDGALDWHGLTDFLTGTTPEIALDTLLQVQRFYQTSPLYLLPVFWPRSHWRSTMFGDGRVWTEGMIRVLVGDVYTEPLFGLPIGRTVGMEAHDV